MILANASKRYEGKKVRFGGERAGKSPPPISFTLVSSPSCSFSQDVGTDEFTIWLWAHVAVSIFQASLEGRQVFVGEPCAFAYPGPQPSKRDDRPSQSRRCRNMGQRATWRRCRGCRSRSSVCPGCDATLSLIRSTPRYLALTEQTREPFVHWRLHY